MVIQSRSDATTFSRTAKRLGLDEGLDDKRAEELAIVALELATNLFLHSRGGAVSWRSLAPERAGVELVAMDQGPGMDVRASSRDGFSTQGTAGLGMGSMRRLSDHFEVVSNSTGTITVLRIGRSKADEAGERNLGLAHRPHPDETVSGDGCLFLAKPAGGLRILVVDGLGHGPRAAFATEAIAAVASSRVAEPLTDVLEACHEAAQPTRGASVTIADVLADEVEIVSIGNISCRVVDRHGPSRGLPAQPGTIGAALPRKARVMSASLSPQSTLVLHSDGITTRWTAEELAPYEGSSSSMIAGVLLRAHSRDRDDATCVVVQAQREVLERS